MTFCLGMRVHDGIVGIVDTRVTSGSECITARKVSIYQGDLLLPGNDDFHVNPSSFPHGRETSRDLHTIAIRDSGQPVGL